MMNKFLVLFSTVIFSLSVYADQSSHHTPIRPTSWNNIKHIVVIILENTSVDSALKQPFMHELTKKGAYLSQYFAVAHPSQPNYLALTAGNIFGVGNDDNVNINATNLADLLEAKSLTWKTYAEDYPGNCFLGESSGEYVRKHNPFISYIDIQSSPAKCKNIVSSTQFTTDIVANNLPSFSLYIPNLKNDGHDTDVKFADKWLSTAFSGLMKNADVLKDTLFIVTFDEDDYFGKNNIYISFVGAGVKTGATSSAQYTHYSLLKTIEAIYGLDSLGRHDAGATTITDIWMP